MGSQQSDNEWRRPPFASLRVVTLVWQHLVGFMVGRSTVCSCQSKSLQKQLKIMKVWFMPISRRECASNDDTDVTVPVALWSSVDADSELSTSAAHELIKSLELMVACGSF